MATLRAAIHGRENDYSRLESEFGELGIGKLVSDPYASLGAPAGTLASVSVVIPSHDCIRTLVPCLRAIARSTFNLRAPDALEVVVVDDGSSDGTLDVLRGLSLPLRWRAVRQPYLGTTHARNTGLASSSGEVVVFCDVDMILCAHALEELSKRHHEVQDALFVGFRSELSVPSGVDPVSYVSALPRFFDDNRFLYDWPGWPENMIVESDRFKRLGRGRRFWVTDERDPAGKVWDLPRMVYGALFSVRRENIVAFGGFSEAFRGWGWEDTHVGARALASGLFIIPVPSAVGYHLSHPTRSPSQWQEGSRNRDTYAWLLNQPHDPNPTWESLARRRILEVVEPAPGLPGVDLDDSPATRALEHTWAHLCHPVRAGAYWGALGRFEDSLRCYEAIRDPGPTVVRRQARALARLGRWHEGLERILAGEGRWPDDPGLRMEEVWHRARLGDLDRARRSLSAPVLRRASEPVYSYLVRYSAPQHAARGHRYLGQGFYDLAWRDLVAAVLLSSAGSKFARDLDDAIQMLASRLQTEASGGVPS